MKERKIFISIEMERGKEREREGMISLPVQVRITSKGDKQKFQLHLAHRVM